MRAVALLSLLALAYAAPLTEQDTASDDDTQAEMKLKLVKRAKEIMMFGDQQNEDKEKEKRSGNMDATVDKHGEIIAETPVDIQKDIEVPEDSDDVAVAQNQDKEEMSFLPIDGNMMSDEEESEAGSQEGGSEEVAQAGEESDGSQEIPVADAGGDGENEINGDIQTEESESDLYEKYLDNYQKGDKGNYLLNLLDNQYGRWEPQPRYQNSYNLYDFLNGGRYRRSRAQRKLPGFPKSRILKRARRIKRDLYFTSDILGRNNDPYEGLYEDSPYDLEQADLEDDEIRYLLGLLDDAERYDDDVEGYDQMYPASVGGYLEPEYEPEEQDYFIPKRQAGLTFVPGLKRSREFYPFFDEPGAHFAAFVPNKRSRSDYADAYQRLMELAAELRAESYYPAQEYDFENYYRRK